MIHAKRSISTPRSLAARRPRSSSYDAVLIELTHGGVVTHSLRLAFAGDA